MSDRYKELLARAIPFLESLQDEGPPGEGWQSDDLKSLLKEAAGLFTGPDAAKDSDDVSTAAEKLVQIFGKILYPGGLSRREEDDMHDALRAFAKAIQESK